MIKVELPNSDHMLRNIPAALGEMMTPIIYLLADILIGTDNSLRGMCSRSVY